MKKLPILVFFITCSFASQSQNIAYIYRDSVLQSVPGYVMHVNRIDSMKNAYTQEMDAAGKNLQAKIGALINPYKPADNESIDALRKRMSADDTARLALLSQESSLIAMKEKTYNGVLQAAYERNVQPLVDRVNTALEKYAKTNRIDVIWMMEEMGNSVAYINRSKNITRAIIAMVK